MTEHLALHREEYQEVAPAPSGIINFYAENGIDPALPPPQIRIEAASMGAVIVAAAFATPVTDQIGEIPYSEIRVETALAEHSTTAKSLQQQKEAIHLRTAQSSPNPAVRIPAENTLAGRSINNSINTPHISKAQTELQNLRTKAQRGGILSLQEKQRIGVLENEVRRMEKANSNRIKRWKTRGRERTARNDMIRVGYSEEKVAEIMDDRGNSKRVRGTDTRETRKRIEVEIKETRNIVGRKGCVVSGIDGNRWIVKDVKSQPAQGFKIIGYSPDPSDPTNPRKVGDPIFDLETLVDPLTGVSIHREKLHDLYARVERPDPSDPTGKTMKITYEPVPRDDAYMRNQVRQSGLDGKFYFKDEIAPGYSGPQTYSMVDPAGIDDDSFSSIDDQVVLQRLFTGAEAFDHIVNGNGPDIEDHIIRIGDLSMNVDSGAVGLVNEEDRALHDYLVFNASDEVIDQDYAEKHPGRSVLDPENMRPIPGLDMSLLAPYDASQNPGSSGRPTKRLSGHFSRFHYTDPRTSRQIAQKIHINDIALQRISANLKKPLAGRSKKLPKL